jgi:enolase
MPHITTIESIPIVDSRGRPTLEVTVRAGDAYGTCRVPSGKSTGMHEAKELRDPDDGVLRARSLLTEEVQHALIGTELEQERVDANLIALDGTLDKSRLGANAIIGVSEAVARAIALARGVPLWRSISDTLGTEPSFPKLYMNIVNGGVHADFRLPFQEYMVVLTGEPRAAYGSGKALFASLGELVRARYGDTPLGDEGGYAPLCTTLDEPFALLKEVLIDTPDVTLAIDAAASQLWDGAHYSLCGKTYTAKTLADLYARLVATYPLTSIEDPFEENDTTAFQELTRTLGSAALVVGDDLTVTNPETLWTRLLQTLQLVREHMGSRQAHHTHPSAS